SLTYLPRLVLSRSKGESNNRHELGLAAGPTDSWSARAPLLKPRGSVAAAVVRSCLGPGPGSDIYAGVKGCPAFTRLGQASGPFLPSPPTGRPVCTLRRRAARGAPALPSTPTDLESAIAMPVSSDSGQYAGCLEQLTRRPVPPANAARPASPPEPAFTP